MRGKIRNFIWEILALVLCLGIAAAALSKKEGYHMDEMICFELANAEYNPWIVPIQPVGRLAKFVHNEIDGATFGETAGNLWSVVTDVLKNRGESRLLTYRADVYEEPVWIGRDAFQDYLWVDGRDDFNLLSVYFNVKDDNHPPLHFMLIHLMTSLFRFATPLFVGGALNLMIFAGNLLLLCRVGRLFAGAFFGKEQERLGGILAMLFYGLSAGALNTVLLFRMYGLVTFFCLSYLYLLLRKWLEKGFEAHNGLLILVTAGGFLTQYFFLFYCLLLALTTAVCLFLEKRRRELFCFVRSQLLAAVIGIAVFPFSIADVLQSGRGVEALDNLSQGLSGYGERLLAFGRILFEETSVVSGVLGLSALAFALLAVRRQKHMRSLWRMLLLPPAGYYLLASRMSPYLVDRYVMPIFPMLALIGAVGAAGVAALAARVGRAGTAKADGDKESVDGAGGSARRRLLPAALAAVVAVLLTLCLFGYDGHYVYAGYREQLEVAGQYESKPCICVYRGYGFYENLEEFARYESTLLVSEEELWNRRETESIRELDSVVVLCKAGVDCDRVAQQLSEYGLSNRSVLFAESEKGLNAHGDTVWLFAR